MGEVRTENHYLVDLIIIGLTEVMKQLLKRVGYIYLTNIHKNKSHRL